MRERDEGIADQHPSLRGAQSVQISGDRNGFEFEGLRERFQLSALVADEPKEQMLVMVVSEPIRSDTIHDLRADRLLQRGTLPSHRQSGSTTAHNLRQV